MFLLFVLLHLGVCHAYDQLVVPNWTIATLSTTYQDFDASRAVDGNFIQNVFSCSHTDIASTIKEAWLQIDLKRIYSIKYVKFVYRNDFPVTVRLPGYSIRGSNGSMLPPPENTCYQDPGGNTLPTIIQNDCEMTSQYVWIYQNNTLDGPCPILEICEVQVFGCETGRYGFNCSKTCNHCKNNETCNIDTGHCDISGCAINYSPPLCKACADGFFGDNCTGICNTTCDSCNKVNGSCDSGCHPGWKGNYCNEECDNGTYGKECKASCGHCFNQEPCYHINGTCLTGCESNYLGDLCQSPASQPATEWKTWLISSLTVILAVGAGVVAVCVIQAKRRGIPTTSNENEMTAHISTNQ
uniref:Multiple epidermal growth factor-like domains protein 10 n=1 Tax=Crassostrea virginica TaxID=6565 RepID=A0A8B8BZY1_CRAVI|nr:multiple epidermal growth factor-like domains protein 10 [Crassostrea virginica]